MKITKLYGKVICGQDNPMVPLKDIEDLLKAEKETWARESIGWKAVESIENAIKDNTK